MPTADTKTYLRAVDKLARAVTTGAVKRADWTRELRQRERADYARLIHAQDWSGLASHAQQLYADTGADLDGAVAGHGKLSGLLESLEAAALTRADLPRPMDLPGWATSRAAIIARLRDRGLTAGAAAALADEAGARRPADAPADLLGSAGRELDTLGQAAIALGASRSGARLARAVAAFNSAGTGPRRGRADAERWCDKIERDLGNRHSRLRTAWAAADRAAAAGAATALLDYAETELARGSLLAAASATRRAAGDDAAEDSTAIRLGDAQRALLTAAAVVDVAGFVAADAAGLDRRGLPQREAIRRWVTAARRVDQDVAVPPDRSVSDVTGGAVPAGQSVTVAGTVGPVSVTHRLGKAVSTAQLTEAGGATLTIALSHIKLDSGGLVEGAAAAVTGTWRTGVAWLEGGDAFLVERHKTERLARRTWTGWLAAEVRDVWTATPHALAVRSSWQPGVDGAGNPLRFGVWHDVH
jgi:hypothetical protein